MKCIAASLTACVLIIACGKGKSSSDRTPAPEPGTEQEAGVLQGSSGEDVVQVWSGYSFEAESDESRNQNFFKGIAGTWIIGHNQGTEAQGIRWSAVRFAQPGEQGGAMVWYSRDIDGTQFSSCLYESSETIKSVTRSKKLSNEAILVDIRFEGGGFQQFLLQQNAAKELVGSQLRLVPLGTLQMSIEDYLKDQDVGGDLLRPVTDWDAPCSQD